MICYQGDKISMELFECMLKLDRFIFPVEKGDSLPPEYFLQLYQKSKDGLFIVVDEKSSTVIGYLCCIVIDEIQRNRYLHGGHYRELKNIGMRQQDNILYLHTIAIHPDYRGGGVIKQLTYAFVEWLNQYKKRGYLLKEVFAEAVSQDGARTLTKGFGMVAIDASRITDDGCGFYHSLDCLCEYCKKISNTVK